MFLKKQWISSLLTIGLLATSVPLWAQTPAVTDRSAVQIKTGITVGEKGDQVIPSISLRDAEIKDVLYGLSEQAGFNLIVDDSVKGTISLDLKDISINKILEYVLTLADLTYYKDGKTIIVTSKVTGDKKSINKLVLKSIPVKYSNATDLTNVLNNTVFSVSRPGGNNKAIATADPRTNSILVMGNEMDIALANRALEQLDFPLQHKTFFLKNAQPEIVANTISQTLFAVSLQNVTNNGTTGGTTGTTGTTGTSGTSGSSTGSSTGSSSSSSSGGSSSSSGGSSSSGSSSGGSGGSSSGYSSANATLTTNTGVTVLQGGPVTFIANDANNTLTLIGTAEQIQLAEAMLYDIDVKPPQVAIQVSVVELDETRTKSLAVGINPSTGLPSATAGGNLAIQGANGGLNFGSAGTTLFWDTTRNFVQTLGGGSSLLSALGINANFTTSKGKILANPTLLAVSGSTSSMSVTTDTLVGYSTTTTAVTGGAGASVSTTPIIKPVGILLNITPQVANDGTVLMQLAPTISANVGLAPNALSSNPVDLTTSNTLTIAQARVKDGETLILAGLINDNYANTVSKIPFLGDIPVIGGLFQPSVTNTNTRKEIIVLVTPHIVKEDGVPYFRKDWQDNISYADAPQVAHAYQSPMGSNTIVPASNVGVQNSNALQTLEQRTTDIQGGSATPNQNLPLRTFSEVLK